MKAAIRAVQSALSLVLVRAEFAAVEFSLARAQAMRWVIMALGASVLALLGLMALSAFLAALLWDRYGWMPVGVLGLLYSLGAAWLLWRVWRDISTAPPVLAETFAELARDREAVFGPGADAGETPDE
jgi:uncharacterized membrane protein YqjE